MPRLADQRRRRAVAGNAGQRFPDLIDEPRHRLHIPPVLPTHVIQRMADLPKAMRLHRLHQRGEHVLAVASGVLQVAQAVAVVDEVRFLVDIREVRVGRLA